tara:strand:+ start:236 stop:364 length:129 start_codon:yes stop_codon:yes gene_type:complete
MRKINNKKEKTDQLVGFYINKFNCSILKRKFLILSSYKDVIK